jgi:leucyl aminopeptidase
MDVFEGDFKTVDTDLLVVGAFEGQAAELAKWSQPTALEVARAVETGEFSGKLYEIFLTPLRDGFRAGRLAAVGLGQRSDFTIDRARRAASAAALYARQKKIGRLAFVAESPYNTPEMLQAIAEGTALASFEAGFYKTIGYTPFELRHAAVIANGAPAIAAGRAVKRGWVIGHGCNAARRLDNEPGNRLTTTAFADRLAGLAREGGLAVEVLDEKAITALGMGMLLGVAQGSHNQPRLVVIRHDPPNAPVAPVLGLVGKGITFDTGGISIKPAADMDRMKDDMAGGAAVAAALRAMAELRAPIRVVGVIPIAENMPGGRALRPGDVLKSASGKTVEVLNTDAEGRLILGDALWYARVHGGATHLVDIATLTGAITVALGKITSGLFGTPPEFVEHVRQIAERAGDRAWPMPLFEEYKDQLRSEIADMVNTAGRVGGAITAAIFLREFTGGLPWAHLDIAGTAWAEESKPFMPKGPTGVGVRTLVELAFSEFR